MCTDSLAVHSGAELDEGVKRSREKIKKHNLGNLRIERINVLEPMFADGMMVTG